MRRSVLVTVCTVALLGAACGGDGRSDPEAQPDAGGQPSPPKGWCEGVDIVAGGGSAARGYLTPDLEAPAGEPFNICFSNNDVGVPHNVVLASGHHVTPIVAGEIVTGPDMAEYRVEALEPMDYHFHCEVHPDTMKGTLTIA